MSDSAALFPRRSGAGRECEAPPVVGQFTARAGSDDASEVGALCCRDRIVVGEFGRAWAPASSRVAGEIVMFLPNHVAALNRCPPSAPANAQGFSLLSFHHHIHRQAAVSELCRSAFFSHDSP